LLWWHFFTFAEKNLNTYILEHLAQHVEALIFASSSPISFQEILDCLEATFGTEFSDEDLEKAIAEIEQRYEEPTFSFELLKIAGGYNFLTKSAYFSTIGTHLKLTTRKRLSKSALETLSLVAYKQPVTKTEMENIRGVGCDYALQKLLEKELVVIAGRSDGPGRPLLYGTSEKFMDYFGLKSLDDMPKPKDFRMPDNTIGEQAPVEQAVSDAIEGGPKINPLTGEEMKEESSSAEKVKPAPLPEMTAEEIEASLVEVEPIPEFKEPSHSEVAQGINEEIARAKESLFATPKKNVEEVDLKPEEEIKPEGEISVGETIELSPEIEDRKEEKSAASVTEDKPEEAKETVSEVETTPEVIAEATIETEPISEDAKEKVLDAGEPAETEIIEQPALEPIVISEENKFEEE